MKLKRQVQETFNAEIEIEEEPSLLAMAYEHNEDTLAASDKITSSNEYRSGSTVLYRFQDQGIYILVRDDRYVIKVFVNAPKLAFGLRHNGRQLKCQRQLDDVISLVENRIRPYVKEVTSFEVSEIELAINVADPVHVLQSYFWGCNLKGSHQMPAIRPGQAVSMNRDPRSDGKRPELSFQLYDKPVELMRGFDSEAFTNLPDNVTRLEFALRGKRVEKEFKGATLDHVTLAAMQDVFWRLFDDLAVDVPTVTYPELGSKKQDMLTRMIYQELSVTNMALNHDEPTIAWWLRANVEAARQRADANVKATPETIKKAIRDASSRAQKQYREASTHANALLGRRLSDYVNRETPFVEIF